jgi:hypothetical protein
VTKLNGKSIKREMRVAGLGRTLIIELDERTQVVRMWEKGCRTHYSLPALTIYGLMIRQSDKES